VTAAEEQAALMIIAVGLYLYDSCLLLDSNEGILVARGRGWAAKFASAIRIRGRELFVPGPLLPHRPMFRLAWNLESAAADQSWDRRREVFRPLMPLTWGMTLALFVLLPLGLFSRLGEPMLLAAIALIYANILAALGWVAYKRAAFGLSGKQLGKLAFESLVCSPFALNLIRKISLATPVVEDLVPAARRLLAPEEWSACRASLAARVQDRLLDVEEGSAEAKALQRYRQTVLEEPCPPPKSS